MPGLPGKDCHGKKSSAVPQRQAGLAARRFAVAWYPVYRIPDAPLTARFLTFHAIVPQRPTGDQHLGPPSARSPRLVVPVEGARPPPPPQPHPHPHPHMLARTHAPRKSAKA